MTKPEINLVNTSDVNIEDATPAMQKFLEIKREHPDCLLLYRMGDFYETFFENSKRLTITGCFGYSASVFALVFEWSFNKNNCSRRLGEIYCKESGDYSWMA